MTILVVDDRREVRHIIQAFLESGGYNNIITAASAERGLEILGVERDDPVSQPIDLILMDIVLDGMDGVEACRKIKSYPALSDVPVVIMTAHTEPENIDKAFDAGAIEFLLKPVQKLELLARVRSIMHFKSQLDRLREREKQLTAITDELETANARLERMSHADGLTGIPNRRYFDFMFKKLMASATRMSIPLSLLLLDIDFFKPYNDTYGHLAGDDALKTIAENLHKTIKRESDFISRYGGEEFAIVLFGNDLKAAERLGENIRQQVEALDIAHEASGTSDRITVSIGIATCIPEPHIKPENLIYCADQALYEAKSTGKNRVVTRDSEYLDDPALKRNHTLMARHYV